MVVVDRGVLRPDRRRSRRPRPLLLIACAVALLAGCGDGEGGAGTATGPGQGIALPQPDPSGDGLAVRLAGSVVEDRFCPGGRPPCLLHDGDVTPDADGRAWVAGRVTGRRLEIDEQLPLPPAVAERDLGRNRCAEQGISGPTPEDRLLELEDVLYAAETPGIAGFADWWESDDGTLHLAVAGDPTEAEAWLADAGLADTVCLVALPRSDAELRELAHRLEDITGGWPGESQGGASGDPWTGTVRVHVDRLDPERRAQLEAVGAEAGGVPVEILATVEVVDGTLDEFDALMADIGSDLDPVEGVRAVCGPVVFTSIPPDLDEFPPLDADAQSAIDELVTGETGVEAGGFDTDVEWSIAFRSDDELILFGRRGEGDLLDARFERRDGAWRPTGWGGCNIEIEAPGFGPAVVATDPDRPPDPASTELDLLIQERACASGLAPTDREVRAIVTETPTTVELLVLVEPVQGDANCPSNPWHPITVELDQPLGDRVLLDAHTQPPIEVAPADAAGLDG